VPVLIDSTKLSKRLLELDKNLKPGALLDIAIKDQLQAGIREFYDLIVDSPDIEDQVGFDKDQFWENIDHIYRLGPHSYGILDTDVMGGADDINALAGVKGMFVPEGGIGTESGNAEKFQQFIGGSSEGFGDPSVGRGGNRQKLETRRRNFWGTKTPQWIVAAYGKIALGIVSEGLARAEVASFIVRNFKVETLEKVREGVISVTGEMVRQEGSSLFGPGAMAHFMGQGVLGRAGKGPGGGRFRSLK
jgi:hypothetical protein